MIRHAMIAIALSSPALAADLPRYPICDASLSAGEICLWFGPRVVEQRSARVAEPELRECDASEPASTGLCKPRAEAPTCPQPVGASIVAGDPQTAAHDVAKRRCEPLYAPGPAREECIHRIMASARTAAAAERARVR